MSTRSAIIIKVGNMFKGIYCHFDGYESGVGATLLQHYADPAKVSALISLGDISSLGTRVTPIGAHSFDKPEKDTTVAYYRDRGELWANVEPKTGKTLERVEEQIGHNGYVYLFSDGVWYVNGTKLTPAMCAEAS